MTSPYEGGQALGSILFGGRNQDEYSDTYMKRMSGHATLAKAMEQARRERSMNLSRDTVTPDVVLRAQAGDLEAQSILGAGAMMSSANPNLQTMTGGLGNLQKIGLRGDAVEALTPTLGAGNAALAGLAGKPLKMNDIDSGYQLNPYEAGGIATPTVGELGKAAVSEARLGVLGAQEAKYYSDAAGNTLKASREPLGRSGGGKQSMDDRIIDAYQSELGRGLTGQELADIKAKKFTMPTTKDYTTSAGNKVKIPAGYTPEMVEQAAQLINARKADGLPPLSKLQLEQTMANFKRTGTLSFRDSDPNEVQWIEGGKAERMPAGMKPLPESRGPAKAGAPLKVNSQAAFAKLPSGTRFIAPDGSLRVKP